MTDQLRQAAQQALEALDDDRYLYKYPHVIAAINALRTALEQPEQEPDRRVLQAAGTHPAPCARHCEAKAYEIEIRSLNSRLKQAQPEQEPVAWMVYTQDGQSVYVTDNPTDIQEGQTALPLFTTPPAAQRPWQGLTDEDWDKIGDMPDSFDQGVAWAAARLKECNT
jgi:hypothetical protein